MLKKRALSILLLFIILILLCSCKDENNKAGLDYQETKLPIPKEAKLVTDFCEMNDGSLWLAATDLDPSKGYIWESKDGGDTWTSLFCYTEKCNLRQDGYSECFAYLSPEKEVICIVCDYEKEGSMDYKGRCFLVEQDGTSRQIDPKLPDSDSSERGNELSYVAKFLDNDTLLFGNGNGELFYRGKNEGEKAVPVFEEGVTMLGLDAYIVIDNVLYAVGADGKPIIYDTKSHKTIRTQNLNFDAVCELYAKCEDGCKFGATNAEEPSFYCITKNGIYEVANGKAQKLLDGKQTGFQDPDIYLRTLYVTDKNELYVGTASEEGLLFLYKTSKYKKKDKVELSIYSLRKDDCATLLANRFQQAYDDVTVTVIAGMSDEGNKTVGDELKALNTRLLSGDGPDILFFDGIDVNKYIDNNVLMDLSEITQEKEKTVFPAIYNSYKKGDVISAIPVRWSFPIIASKFDTVTKSSSLYDFAKQIKIKKASLPESSFNEWAVLCYQTFFYGGLAGDREINKQNIKELYQGLDKLRECWSDTEIAHFRNTTGLGEPTGGVMGILVKENDTAFESIAGVEDYQYYTVLGHDILWQGVTSRNGYYFMPRLTVGVNAHSKHKEESKDFIEFLLSEAGQKINCENMGLSIDRVVLEEMMETVEPNQAILVGHDDKEKYLNLKEIGKNNRMRLLSLADNAQQMVATDSILMEIIMDQAENYLNDEISLDTAVDNALQKVRLYQAE